MKNVFAIGLVVAMLAGCSSSVEHLADQHREQRLYTQSEGHPLVYGAGDGVGGIVPTDERQLTMR